jgi:hypothetical protein
MVTRTHLDVTLEYIACLVQHMHAYIHTCTLHVDIIRRFRVVTKSVYYHRSVVCPSVCPSTRGIYAKLQNSINSSAQFFLWPSSVLSHFDRDISSPVNSSNKSIWIKNNKTSHQGTFLFTFSAQKFPIYKQQFNIASYTPTRVTNIADPRLIQALLRTRFWTTNLLTLYSHCRSNWSTNSPNYNVYAILKSITVPHAIQV